MEPDGMNDISRLQHMPELVCLPQGPEAHITDHASEHAYLV